jgi:propanol-preferring alcohol dehydrogenase
MKTPGSIGLAADIFANLCGYGIKETSAPEKTGFSTDPLGPGICYGEEWSMKAMLLEKICDLERNSRPLKLTDLPRPVPGEGEIVVRVNACGVCHTELDEIEGRTPPSVLPMVLGHQAVGKVVEAGPGAGYFGIGERVGVAWIFSACGTCDFCKSGNENLCAAFMATGRDAYGG